MAEQAVHLSNARLTGRTLSNLDKNPRIWKMKKKNDIAVLNISKTQREVDTYIQQKAYL